MEVVAFTIKVSNSVFVETGLVKGREWWSISDFV